MNAPEPDQHCGYHISCFSGRATICHTSILFDRFPHPICTDSSALPHGALHVAIVLLSGFFLRDHSSVCVSNDCNTHNGHGHGSLLMSDTRLHHPDECVSQL